MDGVYLDHAATTPCRPEVWDAMAEFALRDFGNPNSIHADGRRARQVVENARRSIAACLRCDEREIVFTSSGTESSNLALRGVAKANRHRGRHIVTTAIEHHAVLETCRSLEAEGFEVTYLAVDELGRVSIQSILAALRDDTLLVSIGHANNEIGTLQPIAAMATAVKQHRESILVHTDAVQTVGHVDVDVRSIGADLVSFAAHKFYGPKGIGGLVVRQGVRLDPLLTGGGQERGMRSGTESVPLIVGMALALRLAQREIAANYGYWHDLRDEIIAGILSSVKESRLNGHPIDRLTNNINLSFAGVGGEDLVLLLDLVGVRASTGSACTTGSVEPSHVVSALGLPRSLALGTLRLTLGEACRSLDPTWLVAQVSRCVAELRSTSYRPRGIARASGVKSR